jgi:ATP-dependent DNA helicase RecQ
MDCKPPSAVATLPIERVLREQFGFHALRPGQEETIRRLIEGHSTLAIFPTGSGKSLCYQLPALLWDGLTVVVSPLIALMKDQLDFLSERRIPAARLDSSQSRDEALEVYRGLQGGSLRLLYVSPERLGNERFLSLMRGLPIELLAIDEAHCISQWGHNFRPDYLRLAKLARQLEVGRVLALTATATVEVAEDIARSLAIAPQNVVKTGFYRPNLHLRVTPCDDRQRIAHLTERLEARPGVAIVYVTLQRTAEEVAARLAAKGLPAVAYHAGLRTEQRTMVQEDFMAASDMIVVATIAFGMGVDKADVRAVYHYNLPQGLENYMQEIGRAGRDGQPADCELLACADDVVTLENFTYGDTPSAAAVKGLVHDVLASRLPPDDRIEVSVYELSNRHDTRELVVKTLLAYLELEGVLQPTGAIYSRYTFRPRKSSAEILRPFDADRRALLSGIFRLARPLENGFSLDLPRIQHALDTPRSRIVAALEYLDRQQSIELQASHARLGYRLRQVPQNLNDLVETLSERFAQRERHDVARIANLLQLTHRDACLTQRLLAYFGEHRDPCGHCSVCCNPQETPAATLTSRELTSREIDAADRRAVRKLRAERHQALADPRQLARFLCGLTSPATTRSKLRKHAEFGRLRRTSFADVLALAESEERLA